MLFTLCASLYTEQNLEVGVDKIKAAKGIIKNNTGFFYSFRGRS